MDKKKNHITVPFATETVEELKRIADIEREGNMSAIVRLAVSEFIRNYNK